MEKQVGEQFMLRFVKQIEEVELQFPKAVCKFIFLGRSSGVCCWVVAHNASPYLLCLFSLALKSFLFRVDH